MKRITLIRAGSLLAGVGLGWLAWPGPGLPSTPPPSRSSVVASGQIAAPAGASPVVQSTADVLEALRQKSSAPAALSEAADVLATRPDGELWSALDDIFGRGVRGGSEWLRLVVCLLAERDPPAVAAWIEGKQAVRGEWSGVLDGALRDLVNIWSARDARAAGEWAAGKSDHAGLAPELLLARHDVRAALAWSLEHSLPKRQTAAPFAASIRTPEDARAVAETLPSLKKATNAESSTGGAWMPWLVSLHVAWPAIDLAGWREWIMTARPPVPTNAIEQLGCAISPEIADAWLASRVDEPARAALAADVVAAWAKQAPQAALDWADARLDEAAFTRAAHAAAKSLCSTSPATAVELLRQLPASPRNTDRLAAALLELERSDADAFVKMSAALANREGLRAALDQRRAVPRLPLKSPR